MRFLGGEHLRSGSLLESAMREAINVAGSPRAEVPGTTAAMQAERSRAARLVNAFPNLQDEIFRFRRADGGSGQEHGHHQGGADSPGDRRK